MVLVRTVVQLSKRAKNDLITLPRYIQIKLRDWILSVEEEGLQEVRKIPGYHDEALKGIRTGQRSIRLNRAYRAIYEIKKDMTVEFVQIIEVHKHDY